MSKYKIAKTHHPVEKPVYLQKRFFTGVAIGIVAVVGMVLAAVILTPKPVYVPEFTGGAKVVVDKSLIDFGDVKYEQPVLAEFTVKNVGDEPLNILDEPYLEVKVGCCPSLVKVGAKTLYPGEETTVSTTFTMHEGMGGAHDFRVHLTTDAAVDPHHELTILSNWVE